MLLFIGFLFVLASFWLTAIVAKALGAATASISNVVAAIVVATLVMAPISFAVTSPVILFLLTLVVSTISFAKFLQINLLGAFVVYLANGFIWVVFIVGAVFFGLGLSFDWTRGFETYSGDVSLAAVESTAEEVCACGLDEECQIDEYFTHAQAFEAFLDSEPSDSEMRKAENYSARADECLENPRPYQARALVEAPRRPSAPRQSQPSADEYLPEQALETVAKRARVQHAETLDPNEPSYQEIPVADWVRYLKHPMRVTRKDTKQFEGQASLMPNGDLRLTHRRMGGEFGLVIPHSQVMRVEVFKVWRVDDTAEAPAQETVASAQS